MLGEQGHVGDALTERRQQNVEHLQPVKEIFPELSLLDGLPQIGIAGGNDAHIGFQRARAAEALIFPFLKEPQKLRLRRQAHLATSSRNSTPRRRVRSGRAWRCGRP